VVQIPDLHHCIATRCLILAGLILFLGYFTDPLAG
jgi:hypothetical protein